MISSVRVNPDGNTMRANLTAFPIRQTKRWESTAVVDCIVPYRPRGVHLARKAWGPLCLLSEFLPSLQLSFALS
jgi:hypothetical protein